MCTDLTGRGREFYGKYAKYAQKSGGKISYTLQAIGLLPLLALGIAMLFFTSQWFTKTMYQEVERELYDATKSATTLLNAAYPGDYHLREMLLIFCIKERRISPGTILFWISSKRIPDWTSPCSIRIPAF